VVWARETVATEVCPKSYISSASMAWLEEFEICKRIGYPNPREMTARQLHAMVVLEQELSLEVKRGKQ
jgi:hypothetical protein